VLEDIGGKLRLGTNAEHMNISTRMHQHEIDHES